MITELSFLGRLSLLCCLWNIDNYNILLREAHTTRLLAGICCRKQKSCDKTPGSRPNLCLLNSKWSRHYFQTILMLSARDLVVCEMQLLIGTNPASHSADGINRKFS